ncbi:hypothetical protein [Saccharothrix hoggarensis]|uniref:Uncharacterized protein n=1 Tax=Saccharothrix hoggarensis TaxID=913853 RepID=A0ABW3QP94_9PSEU
MRTLAATVVLLFSLIGCRADGTAPADPGFDGVEATLDGVESDVSEP